MKTSDSYSGMIKFLLVIVVILFIPILTYSISIFLIKGPNELLNQLPEYVSKVGLSVAVSLIIALVLQWKVFFKLQGINEDKDSIMPACVNQQLCFGIISYNERNNKEIIRQLLNDVKLIEIYTTWINYDDDLNEPIWEYITNRKNVVFNAYTLLPKSIILKERSKVAFSSSEDIESKPEERADIELLCTINRLRELKKKGVHINLKCFNIFPSIQIYRFDDYALIGMFGITADADKKPQILIRINLGYLGKFVEEQIKAYCEHSTQYDLSSKKQLASTISFSEV